MSRLGLDEVGAVVCGESDRKAGIAVAAAARAVLIARKVLYQFNRIHLMKI